MNPYKCWKLYFDTAVMKQSDYEWCCILEQYLEDYLSNTAFLNEEDILRDAIFDFNLDSFIEYYGKFQFTFEEESVQLPERWLIDLLGFSKCLLVTVTEVV